MGESRSNAEVMSDDVPFQWIFEFECYSFLSKVYIKEFCAYCIQTGEYLVYYIKTPSSVLIDLDPLHVGVFALQRGRHGFSLNDGDITIDEFHQKIRRKISKDCLIYTTSRNVEKYFSKMSDYFYPDIVNLSSLMPHNYKKRMVQLPHLACERNHSKTDCAKRKVHELARFLRPAFTPYLQCSLILQKCDFVKLANDDSEQVSYGKHYLQAPYYQTLTPVNLLKGCEDDAQDCQYSVEG
jgi:hypothetical protein